MRPCLAAIASHTFSRIWLRTAVIAAMSAVSSSPSDRHTVGINSTGPNSRGCSPSTTTSLMSRPPSQIDTATSRSTAPRSWITSGRDTAADNLAVNPNASASIRGNTHPACCATSSPRTSTRRFFDQSPIPCIC